MFTTLDSWRVMRFYPQKLLRKKKSCHFPEQKKLRTKKNHTFLPLHNRVNMPQTWKPYRQCIKRFCHANTNHFYPVFLLHYERKSGGRLKRFMFGNIAGNYLPTIKIPTWAWLLFNQIWTRKVTKQAVINVTLKIKLQIGKMEIKRLKHADS